MAKAASTLVTRLVAKARNSELPQEDRLAAIRELVNCGRIRRAAQLLNRLQSAPARDAVIALCDRITAGDAHYQQITGQAFTRPNDDESAPGAKRCAILLPTPGARRIIFVFGGNAGWFHVAPVYADRKDCHVIFLHDPSRCFHLCSLSGIGENYQQNLATFCQVADGLGAKEIYCIGYSAGGYPALRYGLDMGARSVLSLAGPTTLDISADPGATLKDYPQLRALYKQARNLGVDLVPLYRAAANPPKVLLVYGDSHKRDALLANRMASLPTVTLEPLPGYDSHGVGRHLTRTGALQPYVDRVIPPLPSDATSAEAAD